MGAVSGVLVQGNANDQLSYDARSNVRSIRVRLKFEAKWKVRLGEEFQIDN